MKFKLRTDLTKELFGITLFRIELLIETSFGKAGELGGYVQKEANLSQDGNAWVYDNALVYDDAQVCGNALVYDDAQVYDNALVCGDALVYGNARVYGNALVYGNARVYGDARVYGNALVYGNARVYGDARVYDDAQVCGDARVEKRHQLKTVTNLNWTLTSLPKGVQVGCLFHTMQEWKEKHLEIGQENGLSPELSKEYYRLMKALRRIQRLEAKGAK